MSLSIKTLMLYNVKGVSGLNVRGMYVFMEDCGPEAIRKTYR